MTGARNVLALIALAGGLSMAGCAEQSDLAAISASRGADALERHGCGACHRIPGIAGADGIVGPPLVDMALRVYIGRGLPNTPENMVRWIRAPQTFAPGSAMPDMQVSDGDAADMAGYLYRAKK